MTDRRSSRVAIVVGLGLVASLIAACLGDVEIADGSPPGGSAGAGPGSIATASGGSNAADSTATGLGPLREACTGSGVRCDGQWLERCVASEEPAPAAWVHIQDCQTPALCLEDPGRCLTPACGFNELHCAGAVAQRCSSDLTQLETVDTCVDAAHCSLDDDECSAEGRQAPCCLAAPCEAGALRCNGADLQRCRDDRTDRDTIATCATAGLCAQSLTGCQGSAQSCACIAPACDAGATRCTGTTLERCNADQTGWEFVETCATQALCELGRSQQPLACQPEKCSPGQHQCTPEGTLQICNADQSDFDTVQDCPGGAAFCDASGGSCRQTPCNVGDTQCNGAQVVSCRSDRTGFDPVPGKLCATPQLCGPDPNGQATCTNPICFPNQFQCAGSQPQKCNAGETAFANFGPACLRAELCSVTRQRCDFCFPSRRECTPDLTASRTCNADGNSFGPLTFCPLGCIASTGACQGCNVGQYTCQNGQLSVCGDGFSFTPLGRSADCSGGNRVSCSGNTVTMTPCGALGCNSARNTCNSCSPGQRQCADTHNFQTCGNDGTFGAAQSCGDGLLCAGAGQCACTPGQPSCSGDTLTVCNPAGTGLVAGARCSGTGSNVLRTCSGGVLTTNTCTSSALCAAATDATCPGCTEGERTCVSGQPFVCTGGTRVPATPCDSGFSCEGAGLCRCAAGDLRCSGSQLLSCSADRQSFLPAASACSGSTLLTCSASALGSQDCGSADLCVASRGGVCATCLDTDLPDCLDEATQESCISGSIQTQICDPTQQCVPGVGCQLISDE
ncbi:MAG TPA: hypothetical protein VG963_13385 [Polyangiaceae bacterium]|nr:hypothetical protein [Polyangiaceae bacterium]